MVVTNSATISTGNELDYLVVSMHGAVETAVEHAVPWAPHYGISAVVKMNSRQWNLPVLTRFMRFPRCLGPRLPWASFHVIGMQLQVPCKVHEVNHDDCLDRKFADFMSQLESWKYSTVTAVTEEDLGRGRSFQIQLTPKVPKQTGGEVWKDCRVGFWQSLHRWVTEVRNLKQGARHVSHKLTLWKKIREAADKLPKYWQQHEQCLSLVSLQFGLRTVFDLSDFLFERVLRTVETSGQHELSQVKQLQKQRLNEWKEKATAGSAKLAHRYLKKPEKLPERPFDEVLFDERPEKTG